MGSGKSGSMGATKRVALCVVVGVTALALAMLVVLVVSFHAGNQTRRPDAPANSEEFERAETMADVLKQISPQNVDTHQSTAHEDTDVMVEVEKSARDERQYRYLVLDNGLKVLLVSDNTTDKAAAAMDVRVGSFADPEDIPGLAHFLEHMLFLGSKKYPKEDALQSLLSSHGGASNAYTSTDSTNYYFDVEPQHLDKVLEVWSRFFIDPLFSAAGTNREMHAVHSEHRKNLQDDDWRLEQLLRTTSSTAHPYHKFSTGDLDTLLWGPRAEGMDVRMELLSFYTAHYSANLMKLCIVGGEPLASLEAMVRGKFREIPNYHREAEFFDPAPVREPEQLGVQYTIHPRTSRYQLLLRWLLPSMRTHFKTKPLEYIGGLLGAESPDSLLSALKEKRWGNAIVAGTVDEGSDYSFFEVEVELTKLGSKHSNQVMVMIYEMIQRIRHEGPTKWRWEEMQHISETEFRFQMKGPADDTASGLANTLQVMPPELVLTGPSLYKEWDESIITSCLAQLTPNRMVAVLMNPDVKDDDLPMYEHWYRTHYREKALPTALLARLLQPTLKTTLKLPGPNPYVTTDFDLVTTDILGSDASDELHNAPQANNCRDARQCRPHLLVNNPCFRVWLRPDMFFHDPRVTVIMAINNKKSLVADARTAMIKRLFVSLVEDALAEQTYQAATAGYSYDWMVTPTGFELTLRGYSQKLAPYASEIIGKITQFKPDPVRFEEVKQQYARSLEDFKMMQPFKHALFYTSYATTAPAFLTEDIKTELEKDGGITVQAVVAEIVKFFSSVQVEMLLHGNVDQSSGRKLMNAVNTALSINVEAASCVLEEPRTVQLPKAKSTKFALHALNPHEENSGLFNHYQIGKRSIANDVQLEILHAVISSPLFEELRTKQQLGYIVGSKISTGYGTHGLSVYVQSPGTPANQLDKKVEAFLKSFAQTTLRNLPAATLQSHIDAAAAAKLAPYKNAAEELSVVWDEIVSQQYVFDRRFLEVEELRKVKLQELIAMFNECCISWDRRKFTAQIYGKNHPVLVPGEPPGMTSTKELLDFKKKQNLYPPRVHHNPLQSALPLEGTALAVEPAVRPVHTNSSGHGRGGGAGGAAGGPTGPIHFRRRRF